MKMRLTFAVAALSGAVALAGCATQVPPDDPVYQKLDALQQQVDQLQKKVQGQGLMDMASQQQQMEQEITELQGQIEELHHDLGQMQDREQSVDKDFDQRLAALEQGASAVGIQAGSSSGGSKQASAGAPSGGTATQAAAAQSAGSSSGPSDYKAYRAAFEKLRNGNDADAITAFKKFIQNYPNSRFVSNAWYWTGEAHYVDGDYKEAIRDFQKVLTKYGNSPKASDSYLKVGYAQYALKDYKSARATFKAVIQRYPGTTAADLARQRLQQMGSQGQ